MAYANKAFLLLFIMSAELFGSSRPMNYVDIVSIEKPRQVLTSGSTAAFVVRKAYIDENCNRDGLYLWNASEGIQKKIIEIDTIEKIVWRNGSLFILGKQDGEFQILSLDKCHQLTTHISQPNAIGAFAVDNRSIYFTQTKYTQPATVQKWKEEGYVYRWGKNHSKTVLVDRKYAHREWEEVWQLDFLTGQLQLVTRIAYEEWPFDMPLISDLTISEDGMILLIHVGRVGQVEKGEHVFCKEYWFWKLNGGKSGDPIDAIDARIVEDNNTPPQVVVQDKYTGKELFRTELNPHLNEISRGFVEPVSVCVDDQICVKGYLVHPVNQEKQKRYPCIIATYGFHDKMFIADAGWHSTFPAQVLANEGYFVLLLNHCGLAQNMVGDSAKAREIEGYNVLKAFERAVDMLDERGLILPDQVGIYGWSHGGFMVEFIISHSHRFKAACIGEGCDYGPTCFYLGGVPYMTKICENIYGGPPWGQSLTNYTEFSSFYRAEHIKTPLLIEYASGCSLSSMEMYVPLRYLEVPAELVIYDGEEHNFAKPKARLASMARKVDWFNRWIRSYDRQSSLKPPA